MPSTAATLMPRIESVDDFAQAAGSAVVVLCWILFASVFLFRKTGPRPRESRRDRVSIAGIVLQGAGFALAWGVRRPDLRPIVPGRPLFGLAGAVLEGILAVVSTWLTIAAVRVLGREWSLQARLVEGHRLVTSGPYALVRHPIYTGMLGMLVATALAFAQPLALPPAILLYAAGTIVRVRSEERLLRAAFGASFEEYARRVPAVLPGWR